MKSPVPGLSPKELEPSHLTLQWRNAKQMMRHFTYLVLENVNVVCTRSFRPFCSQPDSCNADSRSGLPLVQLSKQSSRDARDGETYQLRMVS